MLLKSGDKIAIISMQNWWKEPDSNVNRLKTEAENIGLEVDILYYDKFFITFHDKKIDFWYGEKN